MADVPAVTVTSVHLSYLSCLRRRRRYCGVFEQKRGYWKMN